MTAHPPTTRPKLTEEQLAAAHARGPRTYVEAEPGSGKTGVAAERFGILRFSGSGIRVLGLSFTHSATKELQQRIQGRWGSNAFSWPSSTLTVDELFVRTLRYLLRESLIGWPGGHTELSVGDDWSGTAGHQYLPVGNLRRQFHATLTNGRVVAAAHPIGNDRYGFRSAQKLQDHLIAGKCTHDDVRRILERAFTIPNLRIAAAKHLSALTDHIVVDEIFDANPLDLALIRIATEAGVGVTAIGDPWQALYEFRHALPERTTSLLAELQFETYKITQSHRFATEYTQRLAATIRSSSPSELMIGDNPNVVLASQWSTLWDGPPYVLPISFGRIKSRIGAAMVLLLDQVVRSRLGLSATSLRDALSILKIDPPLYELEGTSKLGDAWSLLEHDKSSEDVLRAVAEAAKALGARRPSMCNPETREGTRLSGHVSQLGKRLRQTTLLTAGLSIHRAKGCQWDRVGVRLTSNEIARLKSGLTQQSDGDRKIYVALTRASHDVFRIA